MLWYPQSRSWTGPRTAAQCAAPVPVCRHRDLKEELMRRALIPVALTALLVASGCGSGGKASSRLDTLSPAAAVRAAAGKTTSGSSKLEIAIDSKVSGQVVKISGKGAFSYHGSDVLGQMTMSF